MEGRREMKWELVHQGSEEGEMILYGGDGNIIASMTVPMESLMHLADAIDEWIDSDPEVLKQWASYRQLKVDQLSSFGQLAREIHDLAAIIKSKWGLE